MRREADQMHGRPETAASVSHLTRLIRKAKNLPTELRVMDLCTGTGCIPLLFHHEFYSARSDIELRLVGIDISKKALGLANRNLQQLRHSSKYVHQGATKFIMADILLNPFADHIRKPYDPLALKPALTFSKMPAFWDILISNPPYISPLAFRTTTARSVRGFEPRLALVPPYKPGRDDTEQGDAFYPILLAAAREMEVKIVLLEVADLDQALRVAQMARNMRIFEGIEIWRDQPDQPEGSGSRTSHDFPLIGQGNARSVLCWQGRGASWLGKGDEIKPSSMLPVYPKIGIHKRDDPHHHGPEGRYGKMWNEKLF
jgi:methylase of polypeptide subunit release factors